MDDHRFDAFTRRLAAPRTRRDTLRALGSAAAAFTGLTLTGRTEAAGGGNSIYAQWCHAHFSGRDAGQCTSDAANGGGLARSACGPGGSGGALIGDTSSYATTTCCTGGGLGSSCADDSGCCAGFCGYDDSGATVCTTCVILGEPCTADRPCCTGVCEYPPNSRIAYCRQPSPPPPPACPTC